MLTINVKTWFFYYRYIPYRIIFSYLYTFFPLFPHLYPLWYSYKFLHFLYIVL